MPEQAHRVALAEGDTSWKADPSTTAPRGEQRIQRIDVGRPRRTPELLYHQTEHPMTDGLRKPEQRRNRQREPVRLPDDKFGGSFGRQV